MYICNPSTLQSAVCALCEKAVKRLTAISVPVVLLACFRVQIYKLITNYHKIDAGLCGFL